MLRLIKFLLFLAVIGSIAVTGYAYLGNMSPEVETKSVPVALDNS